MGPESNDMYWEQSSCWSLEMSVEKLKAQGSSVAATLIFYNSKSVLRDGHIPSAQWSRRRMLSAFLQNIAIQGLQKPIEQKSIEFSFLISFLYGTIFMLFLLFQDFLVLDFKPSTVSLWYFLGWLVFLTPQPCEGTVAQFQNLLSCLARCQSSCW